MLAGIVAILLFATIGQLSHDHRLTWRQQPALADHLQKGHAASSLNWS